MQCQACGMHVKACSTHAEIERKDRQLCSGTKSQTLNQQMEQLVEESGLLPEDVPGHRWVLRVSNFSCSRCWMKVPRICGKGALQAIQNAPCRSEQLHECDLQLRTRVHTSHNLWRRSEWITRLKCGKSTREVQGRVQSWAQQPCSSGSGQQKLSFAPSSSS